MIAPAEYLTWSQAAPLLLVLTSLSVAVVIFLLAEERHRLRTILNLGGAAVKLVLVGLVLVGVAHGQRFEAAWPLVGGWALVLRIDPLSMLFVTLSAVLWFVTTIYAIGYLSGSPDRARFFGFFSLCVTATVGIALAGNLLTFFFFYELLTLSTYPLVVHRGTQEALRAGRTYLVYTLSGSTALLAGIVWLAAAVGRIGFDPDGTLASLPAETVAAAPELRWIFVLLIGGLGVKAALVPLHGWLPQAMVAPAPVSALLHAVAVVKAGAFGIMRVVYDFYGHDLTGALGLSHGLAAVAAVTILYGSLRALTQQDLKRRLAWSTISQISYIVLGIALAGPTATLGGLVHLVHQGIMKITLFFCAGNVAETHGIHTVAGLNGLGRRMPLTAGALTVGCLGMIGLPPTAGFISKWYLGVGAVEVEAWWVVAVLMVSSLLNAAYFLPLVYRAWFVPPDDPGAARGEAKASLLGPALFTAGLTVLLGLFADAPVTPLAWVRLIAQVDGL